MNYKEIEQDLVEESKLEDLRTKYNECFEQVDYYANLFKSGMDTPSELEQAMVVLAGLFSSLNVPYQMIDAEKKNREDTFYYTKKCDLESKGEKVVSASLEKEASVAVAKYRMVRNTFESYVTNCLQMITVCQSRLKALKKEDEYTK